MTTASTWYYSPTTNVYYWSFSATDTVGRTWTFVTGGTDVTGCPVGPVPPTTSTTWTTPGPNGSTRLFKFCYSQISIHTNFQLQSVNEYSGTATMMTGIVLPDLTTWRFDYENNTYGNIVAVYVPTGGSISYTWATRGAVCAGVAGAEDRYVASRTVFDGTNSYTWNYATNQFGLITMIDPLGNDTVNSAAPTGCVIGKVQYYSGSAQSGTLLKTETKTYQDLPDPFPSDILQNVPDPQLLLSTTTTWPNGQVSKVVQTYDSRFSFVDSNYQPSDGPSWYGPFTSSYGLVTSETRYDYGSGAAGPAISTTNTNYLALSNSNYLTANLLDLPSSQIILNSSGNKCAETDYAYDGSGGLVTSGITQQHVAAPSSVRGNLTSVTRQLFSNPCQSANPSSTPLTTTRYVYDTGMLQKSLDPLTNPTTYSYSGTYYGAYPTTVTNALNQATNYTYDFNTGLMTSVKDPNNQTTSYQYDVMLRPTQANFPDTGQTNFYFPNTTTVEMRRLMSGTTWTDSFFYYDGLGREIRHTSLSSITAPPNDQVDICYDAEGRIAFKSYPYWGHGLSDPKVCSGAGDSFGYDALNRTTQVIHSDGTSIQTSYTGRATSVSDEGNGTQRVQRISQVDGLGRLTSLCEVSGSLTVGISGSQTASPCSLDIGGTGFLTTYTYDPLGDLKSVSQGPLNSRTFVYDSLSRLTQSTNPESGTTCYGSVSGGVCQQNGYDADNNVLTKTDARNVATSYQYDALNRETSKQHSDGTPNTVYGYDGTIYYFSGVVAANPIGRLTSVQTGTCFSPCAVAVQAFSYDAMGRVIQNEQCTPVKCGHGYFSLAYTYDLLGDVTSSTNGLGLTLTYTYDHAQRLTSLSSSATAFGPATTLFSAGSINAAGLLSYAYLGSYTSEQRTYDGRWRLTGIDDWWTYYYNCGFGGCNSRNYSLYVLTIPAGGYAANGDILAANDSVNGNWTYGYDAFNRLTSASVTGQAYTYVYDRFGNRWQQNGIHSSQPGFDANNRMIPGLGVTYDAAGNETSDGTTTYTYDAESRIMTAVNPTSGTSTYVYDADGKRVEKVTSAGGTADFLYDLAGHEIAQVSSTGTWTRGEVYAGDRHLATFSGANIYFNHADRLGTERARSGLSGGLAETCTSLPFGDWLTCSGGDPSPMHFTGKERDSESGLDYFGARYNSSQYGRFMTPDPANAGADPSNPQSWNMYSYVLNNPPNAIDPNGLDCIYVTHQTQEDHTFVQAGDCTNAGGKDDNGYFVNGTVSNAAVGNDGNVLSYTYTAYQEDADFRPPQYGSQCVGTCPDTSITVQSGDVTGIPTIGTPPPPLLVNPSQARLNLVQLPMKAASRFGVYLGCFFGGQAENAKPMGSQPEPSTGASDVPEGRMNGQRSAYTRGGPNAALNPQGAQSTKVDRISGAAGTAANFGQCIANARSMP
jgi:RHS repeat-associated protein